MIANRKSPRGKLFSFQSLIVLCLAANNIFTITSRFSCTHDHRIYILMLMAHFLVGQKGMCYSHQYSDAFTSDILSFLRMIIKFDYPNICFKGNNHNRKKGTYIVMSFNLFKEPTGIFQSLGGFAHGM